MASPVTAYNTWDTRRSLGVMRESRPEPMPFARFFPNGIRSEDEYIDFEKLPIRARRLAPFVKPLGQGKGVYSDKQKGMRFKPANLVVEEHVDPLRPLTFQAGLGESLFTPMLTPMQRMELLKAQMTAEAMLAIERRWEWMRARAVIDGKVTCNYLDGTSVLVDFQRNADHTDVLTAGNRFGDAGVSVMDYIQSVLDTMNDAEFGGLPVQIEMGGGVWSVLRKDEEILGNLDKYRPVGGVTIERGVTVSADGSKRYKVGEITVGGGSGQVIELIVNNETFENDAGVQERYVGKNDMVFLGTPAAINGYECFGMIVDPDAEYQALPIFPKDFTKGERVKTHHLSFESAPLMVPINPNATFKATVTAVA